MKLIQLNMWDGRLIRNMLTFLQDQQPDILCLQELEHFPDVDYHLHDIQQATGLNHVYFSPALEYTHFGRSCLWGNCILSRYPFLERDSFFVSGDFTPGWKLGDDFNKRNVQRVKVETPAGIVNILNHHGVHVSGSKVGNETTNAIMTRIDDYIQTLPEPTIFTGDFNLTPDSPSLANLNATMSNLVVDYNIKTTRNFTAKRPVEVIDYIYVSKDIEIKSFVVPDDVVSDHQALVLEI